MKEITFENEFFKSEKINDIIVITVLKDKNKFFGIDLKGCQFITKDRGPIGYVFTCDAMHSIKTYLSSDVCEFKDYYNLRTELRNRTMNSLMGYIINN